METLKKEKGDYYFKHKKFKNAVKEYEQVKASIWIQMIQKYSISSNLDIAILKQTNLKKQKNLFL